jgi:hypothetical protein
MIKAPSINFFSSSSYLFPNSSIWKDLFFCVSLPAWDGSKGLDIKLYSQSYIYILIIVIIIILSPSLIRATWEGNAVFCTISRQLWPFSPYITHHHHQARNKAFLSSASLNYILFFWYWDKVCKWRELYAERHTHICLFFGVREFGWWGERVTHTVRVRVDMMEAA